MSDAASKAEYLPVEGRQCRDRKGDSALRHKIERSKLTGRVKPPGFFIKILTSLMHVVHNMFSSYFQMVNYDKCKQINFDENVCEDYCS